VEPGGREGGRKGGRMEGWEGEERGRDIDCEEARRRRAWLGLEKRILIPEARGKRGKEGRTDGRTEGGREGGIL